MSDTIIASGSFVADGLPKYIDLGFEPDWMIVNNYTNSLVLGFGTSEDEAPVEFYWYKGMPWGQGSASDISPNQFSLEDLATQKGDVGRFYLIKQDTPPGPTFTGTQITKASTPVCLLPIIYPWMAEGDIVQIQACDGMPQLNGLLVTVGQATSVEDGIEFPIRFFDNNTSAFSASTTFQVRAIPIPQQFKPATGVISSIVLGQTTQVQLLVNTLGIRVGDMVRLNIPRVWGPYQLDGLTGRVLAIDTATNTYTLDVDSSQANAFAWPAATEMPFTYAQMVPFGTLSSPSGGNSTRIQMKLGIGAFGSADTGNYPYRFSGPAGVIFTYEPLETEVPAQMYWRAGKSFSVDNS